MRNVLLSLGLAVFIPCSGQLYSADSDFRITAIRWSGTDRVEVEWTSAVGRWYRLERATELAPDEFRIAAPNLEANPPSNTYSDTTGNARCYFYRIAATALPVPYPEPVIRVMGVSEAPVNATLHLEGESSFSPAGRKIVRWRWSVERPEGISTTFIPSAGVPSPTFKVDVLGTYKFYLDVWDEAGLGSWKSAAYQIEVVPVENEHEDEGGSEDDNQMTLGTPDADLIIQHGYDGRDTQYISADDDDDWIEQDGGAGADTQTARAGLGNDDIFQYGGDGDDGQFADGGPDNDIIVQVGGAGWDQMVARGSEGDDSITQTGDDGNDAIDVDGGGGQNLIRIDAGAGEDAVTYSRLDLGQDTALLDGGADSDTLTINAPQLPLALLDEQGQVLYESGQGGSIISVKNVEHIIVLGSDGRPVFDWQAP